MRTPSATALNVVELRDLGDPEHIRIVINQIAAASAADLHEGTIATFDIHDPDNGAAVGAVDSLQVPILTDTPLADDNDFAQVVSGSFAIGEGAEGDYTFNFHTDDGFAMRLFYDGPGAGEDLVNVPFTKIGPNGLITTDGAVAFPHTTGDSNVQAAVNLAEGTYSFEMVWFEDGGGAIAEVSADAGDFVDNPAGASWLLLGDQFGLALIDGLGTGPVNLPPVLVGDYNGNGRVEQADLDLVLLNWGTALNQPWVDGTVDQAELDGVLLNWGNEAALGSAAGVPEPATWLAASICGLIGVALRRGRREG
jgi:hypothetical protein